MAGTKKRETIEERLLESDEELNELPSWMIHGLKQEKEKLRKHREQIPLYPPLPMPKEQVEHESDIIEEEVNRVITFDI